MYLTLVVNVSHTPVVNVSHTLVVNVSHTLVVSVSHTLVVNVFHTPHFHFQSPGARGEGHAVSGERGAATADAGGGDGAGEGAGGAAVHAGPHRRLPPQAGTPRLLHRQPGPGTHVTFHLRRE